MNIQDLINQKKHELGVCESLVDYSNYLDKRKNSFPFDWSVNINDILDEMDYIFGFEFEGMYFNYKTISGHEKTGWIKNFHTEPKLFENSNFKGVKDVFLEIGLNSRNEQICIYIGDYCESWCCEICDPMIPGGIYLFGYIGVKEIINYDADGKVEYSRIGIYDFQPIANGFDQFNRKLYHNGDVDGIKGENYDPNNLKTIYDELRAMHYQSQP
jgi:hypothetical protein